MNEWVSPQWNSWNSLPLSSSSLGGYGPAQRPMLRKEKRTKTKRQRLNEWNWRIVWECRWRKPNQSLFVMKWKRRLIGVASSIKRRTKQPRCAASPFFSSLFVGPRCAVKKESEKKWWGCSFSSSLLHCSSFFIHWMRQLGQHSIELKKISWICLMGGYGWGPSPLPQPASIPQLILHCFISPPLPSLLYWREEESKRINEELKESLLVVVACPGQWQ